MTEDNIVLATKGEMGSAFLFKAFETIPVEFLLRHSVLLLNQSQMIKQNSLRELRGDYYFMLEVVAHVEFMQSPQLWYNKPLTDPIFELQVGVTKKPSTLDTS